MSARDTVAVCLAAISAGLALGLAVRGVAGHACVNSPGECTTIVLNDAAPVFVCSAGKVRHD